MSKDYKVTSLVNKDEYLKLRGRLMLQGVSFSDWLQERIGSSLEERIETRTSSSKEPLRVLPVRGFQPVPKPGKK